MNKYNIIYKNSYFKYSAENAEAAMEKFAERKVFGENLVWEYRLMQYDAETRGELWAIYKINNDIKVTIEKI